MKTILYTLMIVISLIAVTGCATVDDTAINERVVYLNEEVTRLNQELQQKDLLLQQEIQKSAGLEQQVQSEVGKYGGYPAPVDKKPLADLSSDTYQTPTGFEVKAKDLQVALKNAGYYKGTIDGKVGPESRTALRAFQKDNKLEADGVCGPKTWEQLKLFLDKQG